MNGGDQAKREQRPYLSGGKRRALSLSHVLISFVADLRVES